MEILIITGLSGSGKSRAAAYLEDIGYYIVDNLPAEMMVKFADFCAESHGRYDRVALVYDVRAGEPFDLLLNTVKGLKARDTHCCLLFLEADTPTLIARYKETRRAHPLALDGRSIEQAIAMERELMAPVRESADVVLDSTSFSTAKLRSELLSLFGRKADRQGITVNVMSFGYKRGLPMEADLVLDVRFMPNPYYVPQLKEMTGLDREVRDYVFSFPQTQKFLDQMEKMLAYLLPLYNDEGKAMLVVAFGCTGGRHRSTAVAQEVGQRLQRLGYPVSISHRDISR